MDFFGLQFTQDQVNQRHRPCPREVKHASYPPDRSVWLLCLQVLGLFGLYDDDRSGSLEYYEFVEKMLDEGLESSLLPYTDI